MDFYPRYPVIANDSVQTLGTWIQNNDRFNWKVMWGAASAVPYTLWYGWYMNGGDISYGRLNKISFKKYNRSCNVSHLLLLTRIGVPASTSFPSVECICKYICIGKNAC